MLRVDPVVAPEVGPPSRGRVSRLLLGVMIGLRLPGAVAQPVSQDSVVKSVANLFPDVPWTSWEWPFIEDSLCSFPSLAQFARLAPRW